jgi:uncharacterized protein DUF3592
MESRRTHAILGSVFGLVGAGLLVAGIAVGAATVSFMTSAERVDGKVVDMTERTTSDSSSSGSSTSTAWYPTVEFDVDGKAYSFQSSVGRNPPGYEIGDTVEVAYAPGDPDNARMAAFWSAYLLPLILGGIGIVFTSIGVVLFVIRRRTSRPVELP